MYIHIYTQPDAYMHLYVNFDVYVCICLSVLLFTLSLIHYSPVCEHVRRRTSCLLQTMAPSLMHICIYIYAYTNIHIYMYVYIHIHIYMYMSMYMNTYVHIHITIYNYIYIYTYVYVLSHIYDAALAKPPYANLLGVWVGEYMS